MRRPVLLGCVIAALALAGAPGALTAHAVTPSPVRPAPVAGTVSGVRSATSATSSGDPNAEWPSYGHDPANTRTSTGGPAPTTVPTLKQAWRLDVSDGDFTSTPVVVGGTVYIGSNGGVVRALDALTGAVGWTTNVGAQVNGTVAVDAGKVIVPVAQPSSPSVVALDAATGGKLWETVIDTQTNSDVFGSPTVASGVVYQGISGASGDPNGPLRGGVVALDEATGALKWHTYSVAPGNNGGAVWATPAVDLAGGRIYVGTGNAYSGTVDPQTDSILALDLSGNVLGHFQATAGDTFSTGSGGEAGLDFDFGASPNLISVDGTAMVGEGQKSGTYWVLPADLDPAKAQSLPLGPGSAVGGILGSTAYDGHAVFGPITAPGYLWSAGFAAGHLAPNWVSPGAADPLHWSPVAVSNDVVYSANSTGFLDARLASTGTLLAHLPLNAVPPATPPSYTLAFGGVSVAEGMVFADTGTQGATGAVVAFTPA